jgi:hypothetical protein
MLKDNLLGVGGLLATMALVSACGDGEIGDSLGEARGAPDSSAFDGGVEQTPEVEAEFAELRRRYRRSTSATVEPAPTNALPPACSSAIADVSASNGWRSIQASQAAFDTLRFEFMVRPAVADLNGLVAVGAENIDEFTDAAMSVRFTGSGVIDARNGAAYDSDVFFAYNPGTWYKIVISADIAARTYDVQVGRCGEPLQALISGAAFRSDWPVSDRLTTWAVWSSQSAALELSTPAWVASGSCAPATCQSLGSECGELGDGCGSSLNCGSCGSGEACASGVCVDVSTPPPAGSCVPATCPSLGVECGGASDGCGGSLNCGGCASGQTCATGGVCVNVSTPPPPPPGDARGRGPTGQWPAGFPAYSTAANIVTNGSNSGLTSALNSNACSNGCIIEHPGNISSLTVSSRAGSGKIVVRPPIGQRANYTMGSVKIQVDNVLFAGFAGGNGSLLVEGGENSGFAWIEINGPGGTFGVYCYGGSTSGGLFYELLYRQYASMGSEDRGVIRGDGGTCNVDVRGSVLTGSPTPPPSHSDTLQNYNPGGSTNISVSDSVVWASWDKCFQNEGGDNPMILTNVFVMTPGYSEQLWQGSTIPGPLDGYFHTTAAVEYRDSTLVGAGNSSWPIPVWNSELYKPGTYTDKGGNTILGSLPSPPTPPTHTQLDAIWSP